MDRSALDAFTRDIWRRFDHADLEPLKADWLQRTPPPRAANERAGKRRATDLSHWYA